MGSSSSDDDGRGRSAAAGADGGGAVVVVGGGGGGGKHGRLKSVCWSESRERGKRERESARERLQTEASLASRESEWCRHEIHEIQGESAKRELPHNCSSQPELLTAAATASRAR